MKLDKFIRTVLGLLIVVVFFIAIGALLFFTQTALNVWDRLLEGPWILRWGYVGAMIGLVILAGYLIWLLLVRRKAPAARQAVATAPLTRDEIEARLRDAETAGVDVSEAQRELQELASRQQAGVIHLCFFGEISTGKSSLIKALVPEADVAIDVVGGSTGDVRHYRWQSGTGSEILLTDVPGTGGHEEGLDDMALDEAQRAHVVLFVCDGDLTRAESRAVGHLLALDKPLVLVMNKSDRFTVEEQAAIMQKLLRRIDDMGGSLDRDRVVAVSAGGEMDIVQRSEDGSESVVRRKRPADIGVLVVAINRMLEDEAQPLDVRRDRAVFRLAAEKLAEAEERAVPRATLRADNSQLYAQGRHRFPCGGEPWYRRHHPGLRRHHDDAGALQTIWRGAAGPRVGKALPLTLAVAGNGLKAFPGIGTVAGGLVHAVAYGLIFDALGRSLVMTLKRHGELVPEKAAKEFEEGISEHIEAGVRRVARVALEEKADAG
jgi:GTP-binding protein EngB required for normal cell division